jgi:predicted kinase
VPVFLLTGPSAAGKTTVGRLLALRFPRGVHVEGDVFRRSIVRGREEMTPDPTEEALAQLRLRYRLAVSAADAYADAGYAVVLEDVVAGPLLTEVVEQIGTRPLHLVVLLPRPEALAARDAGRDAGGYERWTLDRLWQLFAQETPRIGLWLDTSDESPQETVAAILERAADATV